MPERMEEQAWRIVFVVIVGSIMSLLDTTIVNIALETLGRELHTTLSSIQWVITGYMLSLGAVIPVSGWAARRFGAKQVYLLALVLFTAGSVLCGFASTSGELIVFRILQGIGGGLIFPVGQMMMARAAGPKRMGRVMGVAGAPIMLAPVLGPVVGGVILDNATWRWIFFVNLPVGVIAFFLALRLLPRTEPQAVHRLDLRGLALMASGVPLLTYGLAEIGATGSLTTSRALVPLLGGIFLITVFVVHALHVTRPLLDLRLYRRATFASASIAMLFLSAAMFGGMILLPLYWQQIRGESVLHTGLLTAPMGLGLALAMPIVGRISDRIAGGPLSLVGVCLTMVATIPFGFIGAHTSIAWLSVVLFFRGVGMGFASMPAMTAAFASLHRDELSDGTPQLNVLQRISGSIGTAVLAVVLQRALSHAHGLDEQAAGYGTAFWWTIGLTGASFIPCIVMLRAERAARRAHPVPDPPPLLAAEPI